MEFLNHHFLLLQINDSLFPIGGYSHSYGLETYIQKGLVHDLKTAEEYIRNRLRWNFLYTDLLAARLAWEAAEQKDAAALDRLEDVLEASRIPLELREASRKLGSRFVKTLAHMDADGKDPFFRRYLADRKGKSVCHPCAYGAFCACAGIGKEETLAGFLYAQASAMVTNCVKTIPLSQSDGQKLLLSLHGLMEELVRRAEDTEEEMLCASTLGFDLRSIQHEGLYSRIYMS